jgi:hypothetical protein
MEKYVINTLDIDQYNTAKKLFLADMNIEIDKFKNTENNKNIFYDECIFIMKSISKVDAYGMRDTDLYTPYFIFYKMINKLNSVTYNNNTFKSVYFYSVAIVDISNTNNHNRGFIATDKKFNKKLINELMKKHLNGKNNSINNKSLTYIKFYNYDYKSIGGGKKYGFKKLFGRNTKKQKIVRINISSGMPDLNLHKLSISVIFKNICQKVEDEPDNTSNGRMNGLNLDI